MMTVADEEKTVRMAGYFSAKRELSKRDFYIYYQKSLLQGGVIWNSQRFLPGQVDKEKT